MIKSRIYITLFLITLGLITSAQPRTNLVSVDAETYSLWQRKDWDGVIKKGREALRANIDFYYLRVRMGIAYYEKKNFHQALLHFEKAYKQNTSEMYLKEYLYYSYLFAGREADARVFAKTLPSSLKEKLGIVSDQFIDNIDVFYTYSINNQQDVIDDYSINVDLQENGSQVIGKSLGVLNVGLMHVPSPHLTIYHSYSNIQKKSFLYLQEDGVATTNLSSSSILNQYYLSGNIRVARGLLLNLGFHYINLRFPYEVTTVGQGQPRNSTQFISKNDIVGFASVYKKFSYFSIGTSLSYSALNDANQLQNDFTLSTYPLGNLNFYSTSTASIQKEMFSGSNYSNRFVFQQLIGTKIYKHLWIEGFASWGDVHNFIRNDGYTVYNGTEVIKSIYGGNLIIFASSKLKFAISYNMQSLESFFSSSSNYTTGINKIEYTNHSLTGGLIWKL